jgi:peroxiredoxin Q/BCP
MSKIITLGDPAPDFELEDVEGKRIRLSDFRGKPVILAFLRGFQ